ncbi:MAG: PAS domain S-box protein [Nitriliruptoraceae bacterium]|nr:PAS domain S-box protein [Nitriliruptoraceae bacterium]
MSGPAGVDGTSTPSRGAQASIAQASIARALAAVQPFGAVSCLPDWRILDATGPVLELLDLTREQVIGQRFSSLLSGPDRIFHETHHAPILRLHGIAREMAVDLRAADGSARPVLLTSVLLRDAAGDEVGIRIGVADARHRRRYEDELLLARRRAQRAEAQQRTLRELLAVLASAASVEQVVAVLRTHLPAATTATELTLWLRGVDGRTLIQLDDDGAPIPGTDRPLPTSAAVTTDGTTGRVRIPLSSGARCLGLIELALPAEDHVDHTDLLDSLGRQAGQVLERAQLHDEREWLLHAIAHDLRTPLAAIGGFARTLQAHGADDETMQALLLQRIVAGSERLTRMADDLLDTAAAEHGALALRRADHAIGGLVEATVRDHVGGARLRGVRLEVEDRSAGARASVDADRLRRVVDNLVANAVRFSPRDGRVRVVIEHVDDELTIGVHDQGPGIAPADRERLFEPFVRAARPDRGSGAGLGLSIARQLIEAHGGSIEVAGEHGAGASFVVRLPLGTGH